MRDDDGTGDEMPARPVFLVGVGVGVEEEDDDAAVVDVVAALGGVGGGFRAGGVGDALIQDGAEDARRGKERRPPRPAPRIRILPSGKPSIKCAWK